MKKRQGSSCACCKSLAREVRRQIHALSGKHQLARLLPARSPAPLNELSGWKADCQRQGQVLSWENARARRHQSSSSTYSSSGLRSARMWAPQIEMCWSCFHKPHLEFLCKAASWQGCKPHLNHSGTTSQRLKDEAQEQLSLPARADISHFSGLPSTPHTALLCHLTPCCQHHLREASKHESQQITVFLLPIVTAAGLGASWNVGLVFQVSSLTDVVSTTEKHSGDTCGTPVILNI